MSKSSDERIERHKEKQQQAAHARVQQEQRAVDQEQRKDRFLAELRAKWGSDTHIIAEILKDFGPKLDGEFRFVDLGAPPPNMAAHGRISGCIGNQAAISVYLTVDEHGQLHAAKSRPIGPATVKFHSSHPLVVTNTTREQYEDLILDLLDIEK